MGSHDVVRADYSPAIGVRAVCVPGWPVEQLPRVEARTDNRDAITIMASRCHRDEEWRLRPIQGGMLVVVRSLQSVPRGGQLLRTVYDDAVVLVPPGMVQDLTVHQSLRTVEGRLTAADMITASCQPQGRIWKLFVPDWVLPRNITLAAQPRGVPTLEIAVARRYSREAWCVHATAVQGEFTASPVSYSGLQLRTRENVMMHVRVPHGSFRSFSVEPI